MSNIKCKVTMNGENYQSDDFVCVMADEEVGARILYCADAITLGMAVQLVVLAYRKELDKLSEEDKKAVLDALNIGAEGDLDNE